MNDKMIIIVISYQNRSRPLAHKNTVMYLYTNIIVICKIPKEDHT